MFDIRRVSNTIKQTQQNNTELHYTLNTIQTREFFLYRKISTISGNYHNAANNHPPIKSFELRLKSRTNP